MPGTILLCRGRRAEEMLASVLPIEVRETHAGAVFLVGDHAYKLKKPIRLPFLDFTTLAARRHFCEEELRLNRRLAPSLYLDMVEVRDSAAGPTFGGDGPVLDIAVRMRRFPDGALWSEMLAAGSLAPHHIDAMARRLSDFHHAAPLAPPRLSARWPHRRPGPRSRPRRGG